MVQAIPSELPALRQRPGPDVGLALPPSMLKHADDQTVVGLAAVFRAIHDHRLEPNSFADWGVVAGPRFLGRALFTTALQRFAAEGAWGVSPHLIPHRSLHAVSGTVSQALHLHGPNFGVGGGPNAALEAILAAVALLGADRLPGVWLVLTEWQPELVPDRKGRSPRIRSASGMHSPSCRRRLREPVDGYGFISMLRPIIRPRRGRTWNPSRCLASPRPFSASAPRRRRWSGRLLQAVGSSWNFGGAANCGPTPGTWTADRGWNGEPALSQRTEVWISGVGAATPLGFRYDEIAANLLAGHSGVRRVESFDVSQHPSQIAGQIGEVPCPPGWFEGEFRGLHPQEQLVHWCCASALRDAGWWERRAKSAWGWCSASARNGSWRGKKTVSVTATASITRNATARQWSGPLRGSCKSPDHASACPPPARAATMPSLRHADGWSLAGWTFAWPAPATWP